VGRGVARREKADGESDQDREKSPRQRHLHGFQSSADDGLGKGVVPPALARLARGFAKRQRQHELRQRKLRRQVIISRVGDLGKIRRQHPPQGDRDLG